MTDSKAIIVQAIVQTLISLSALTLTLFGSAGQFDIVEFWFYAGIIPAISGLGLPSSIRILCVSACGLAGSVLS
jgi:hypothetical protein